MEIEFSVPDVRTDGRSRYFVEFGPDSDSITYAIYGNCYYEYSFKGYELDDSIVNLKSYYDYPYIELPSEWEWGRFEAVERNDSTEIYKLVVYENMTGHDREMKIYNNFSVLNIGNIHVVQSHR